MSTAEAPTSVIVDDRNDTGNYQLSTDANRTKLRQIGNLVEKTRREIVSSTSEFERMMLQTELMNFLEEQMDDQMVERLLKLQNNPNGFKTDNRDGYNKHIVKRVAIQAFVAGFRVVGNEINIIAGQLYPTKEGFERMLREIPGFRKFRYDIGKSERKVLGETKHGTEFGEATFTALASWELNGVRDEIKFAFLEEDDFRIVTMYYATDTEDLLRGKAESKLFRRVFKRVAGFDTMTWKEEESLDDGHSVDAVASKRIEETKFEPEHQTPKELMDRAAKWLDTALQNCNSTADLSRIEKEAMKRIQDNSGGCSEDEVIAIQQQVKDHCDQVREEIKSNRGERSNSK